MSRPYTTLLWNIFYQGERRKKAMSSAIGGTITKHGRGGTRPTERLDNDPTTCSNGDMQWKTKDMGTKIVAKVVYYTKAIKNLCISLNDVEKSDHEE